MHNTLAHTAQQVVAAVVPEPVVAVVFRPTRPTQCDRAILAFPTPSPELAIDLP